LLKPTTVLISGNRKVATDRILFYSHNRNNEVNLNLIYAKLNYSASHLRTNLALMYGTYANANLAAEPFPLRYIFEANIGFRLSKKKELWLDGGISSLRILALKVPSVKTVGRLPEVLWQKTHPTLKPEQS
jgi:hypothetical protein